MNVLQLGPDNWAKKYEIPKSIDWEFNNYTPEEKHNYNVVIISGENHLSDQDWETLQWRVDPYNVIYLPGALIHLSPAAKHFLRCQAATENLDDPQTIINNLPRQYFWGQSGIRFAPSSLMLLTDRLQFIHYLDAGHLLLKADTNDEWVNIGSYKNNIFLDPNRLIKLWLEYQTQNIEIRLRVFLQYSDSGGDGDPNDSFILNIDSLNEVQLPIKFTDSVRYVNISVEVRGNGSLKLGVLHSRWSREGKGEFITGGQRIVNPSNREDVAVYFNPGDLKPPLNVYFSGARGLEGFEAFPLFRNLHAPTILVTDMRLEVGQFYTTSYMEEEIKKFICYYLDKLGFNKKQLIMNGISMGTYPAMKLGAQLGAYAINVAKPLANLGLIAKRGRLERPEGFETIFDMDNQLVTHLKRTDLDQLDQNFWHAFNHCDLSQTRLFVGYMENDDYDNQAIEYLRQSPAVAKAKQFATKGFAGRHNDDPSINSWFVGRLTQMLKYDFGRDD